MKRSVEGEDGWTAVGRGARSGDSRSPPVKKPDNRSSPISSSKGSAGIPTSPNKYSPLAGEEEEEEEDENNRKGGDHLDRVQHRVVGVGEA